MKTTMRKGRHGWEVTTRYPLPDVPAIGARAGRPGVTMLTIETGKNLNGGIAARASVSFHGDTFTTHAFGMGGGRGDYSRRFLESPTRCTEKAVQQLHGLALQQADGLIAEARAHYQAQKGANS